MKYKFAINLLNLAVVLGLLALVSCKEKEEISPTPTLIKIIQQPTGGSVCLNSQFDLSVVAECHADLHYQWEVWNNHAWLNVYNDRPNYQTSPLSSSFAYRVLIYSDDTLCLPIYSQKVEVLVVPEIQIIKSSSDTIINVNSAVSLQVKAIGGNDLHYDWEVFNNDTWQDLNQDTAVLLINSLDTTTSFRVNVFSGAAICSGKTSAIVTVRVIDIQGNYAGYCIHDITTFTLGEFHQSIDTFNATTAFTINAITEYSLHVIVSAMDWPNYFYLQTSSLDQDVMEGFTWVSHHTSRMWVRPATGYLRTSYTNNLSPHYLKKANCYYTKV